VKNIIKISMVTILVMGVAASKEIERYGVKSAKIEYEIKGSGNIMGMVKTKMVGKKRLIFDNYGAKALEEESKVSKETALGNTKVKKTHTLRYINGMIVYGVDFDKKEITRQQNSGLAMANMMSGDQSIKERGEAMLKQMGGKKVGMDKVAGYSCDVWELSGVKQCIYKGVPLRIESDIMGIKSLEVATKASFDLSLDEDDFKLPDYPVYNYDMEVMMAGGKPEKLDKTKLEAMDKHANREGKEQAKKQAKEQEGMLKGMAAGLKAAQEAGYNPSLGKEMTPAQEEAMQKAMIEAMGGEKKMLERSKKEILSEGEGMPTSMRRCVEKAQTMKSLEQCFPKE